MVHRNVLNGDFGSWEMEEKIIYVVGDVDSEQYMQRLGEM